MSPCDSELIFKTTPTNQQMTNNSLPIQPRCYVNVGKEDTSNKSKQNLIKPINSESVRPKLAKTLKKENRKGTIPPPHQNISNHKPLTYQTHHNAMRDNVKHKTKILETKQAYKLSHSTKQNRIGYTKGQEPLNTPQIIVITCNGDNRYVQ